jgi:hypothetical protein
MLLITNNFYIRNQTQKEKAFALKDIKSKLVCTPSIAKQLIDVSDTLMVHSSKIPFHVVFAHGYGTIKSIKNAVEQVHKNIHTDTGLLNIDLYETYLLSADSHTHVAFRNLPKKTMNVHFIPLAQSIGSDDLVFPIIDGTIYKVPTYGYTTCQNNNVQFDGNGRALYLVVTFLTSNDEYCQNVPFNYDIPKETVINVQNHLHTNLDYTGLSKWMEHHCWILPYVAHNTVVLQFEKFDEIIGSYEPNVVHHFQTKINEILSSSLFKDYIRIDHGNVVLVFDHSAYKIPSFDRLNDNRAHMIVNYCISIDSDSTCQVWFSKSKNVYNIEARSVWMYIEDPGNEAHIFAPRDKVQIVFFTRFYVPTECFCALEQDILS